MEIGYGVEEEHNWPGVPQHLKPRWWSTVMVFWEQDHNNARTLAENAVTELSKKNKIKYRVIRFTKEALT